MAIAGAESLDSISITCIGGLVSLYHKNIYRGFGDDHLNFYSLNIYWSLCVGIYEFIYLFFFLFFCNDDIISELLIM